MKCRSSGVYQYAVAFCPDVDSLWMRYKLLEEQRTRDIIGDVSVSCLPMVGLTNLDVFDADAEVAVGLLGQVGVSPRPDPRDVRPRR